MKDDELLNHLLNEIQETLNDFEQRALRMVGTYSHDEMKAVFRAAHNIKGGGYLFGMNEFGAFVHTVEEMLGALIEKAEPITEETIDLLLIWHQAVMEWVEALRKDQTTVMNFSAIHDKIIHHTKSIREAIKANPKAGAPASPFKSNTPQTLASNAEASAKEQRAPRLENPGVSPIQLESLANPAQSPAQSSFSEPSVQAAAVAVTLEPAESLESQEKKEKIANASGKFNVAALRRKQAVGSLRIPSVKVDDIMQIIGELSIHQSILMHGQQNGTLNSHICSNSVQLNQKALRNLHELVLSLRMQPVESLFQRVERTARDLARQQSKKVNITVVGADTLLDKTVIEMMVDPMVHLVRNAIDHGIESEAIRTASGKKAIAHLILEAQQDAGQVIISMTDDGKGMDPAVIAEKAIKKGLIPENHNLSENDLLQLIYLPGFSTREVADAISGRGVGMDVVKEGIQRLGGRIELFTKKGKGTCFQISLPTSLEIIDGLVVRLGTESYIAPMQDIVEIVDLRSCTIERFGKNGWATRLRDLVVPIEDLSDYLGNRPHVSQNDHNGDRNLAIIVRLEDGNRMALKIDQILTQQQVVVRPLSEQLSKVPGFTGVTILGNGEPTLILNILFISECYLQWTGRHRRAS